jgi:L-amino acid N-acyltransferase YncA
MTEIRIATPSDAAQMLSIYTPYITNNAISFEVTVPSVAEFEQRITATLGYYPWLACESAGRVVGYAYASQHRERQAYQWSVECSVYVDQDHRRKAIGLALYTSLFACLRLQGYANVLAGITLPNVASQTLHERLGFEPVGMYKNIGYKLGAWSNVWWGQLTLSDLPDHPSPAKAIADISGTPAWQIALASGNNFSPNPPRLPSHRYSEI